MEAALWVCLFCLQSCLLAAGQNSIDMSRDLTKDQDIMTQTRLKRETNLSQTGAITVKGSPNLLIQVDRSRRHLSNNKRKLKRKSRVGSFSLLSNNNPAAPLQVTRVKRDDRQESIDILSCEAAKLVVNNCMRTAVKAQLV
ncbi:uncharacterized protein si:dkey-12l12.1 [Clupea harengus]|uniref:Uncharacterized protein si:dkey-12l12.1 n=1 Tax=Clupea harengus TaxID=7950 RepID=A0A8M1KUL9_CLUHA|nr:uncharacterized protein si:dkey-12l12.1 [Clupea harengus]